MRYGLIIIIALLAGYGYSQYPDTVYVDHYFSDGTLSTREVKLTGNVHWGSAKAFDGSGKEIYSREIRNVAGHASVVFRYYQNGAVKSAHYTSHPDGGIQRYDVLHTFNEDGTVSNIRDMSTDDQGRMKLTTVQPAEVAPAQPKRQTETMECAVIYATEVYLVNLSGKTVDVRTEKSSVGQQFSPYMRIADRDTVKAGGYIEAQMYTHPKERVAFMVESGNRKTRLIQVWDEWVQESPEKRVYYLLIVDA